MLEMPGRKDSGNLKNDFENLVRWAQRLVPQLEQQMANLGTDNFTSAYNERLEGMTTLTGAPNSKTTAEAVAEHLLDRNNPHHVSLGQLGYEVPQAVVNETTNGGSITLGGIMLQWKTVEVPAGTGTASGQLYYLAGSLGDWDTEFSSLITCWAQQKESSGSNSWIGSIYSQTKTSAGTVKIFRGTESIPACTVTIYGIGRA
jgi:hypothetical protein